MSLKKDWTTAARVTVPNAVHKITAATFTARGLEVQVRSYVDVAESQKAGGVDFDSNVYTLPFDKSAPVNAHTQAYTALKSHVTGTRQVDGPPDAEGNPTKVSEDVMPFAGATDV